MYEIEKNIPVPTKGRGVANKASIMRKTLLEMEIGDSFKITKSDCYVFGNAKKFLSDGDKNKKFIARKIEDSSDYRIFRTD